MREKMAFMLFSEPIKREIKVEQAKCLVKLASSCSGKAFGEFVRNMIILKNEDSQYINLWFTSESDAERFILKAKMKLNFLELERNIYSLFYESNHVIYVKIFVENKLPVEDFDVNCLTYYYENNVFFLDREILTIKVDLIIESVMNKKMLMFYKYGKNLDDSKLKIISTYSENDWKIRYNGKPLLVS